MGGSIKEIEYDICSGFKYGVSKIKYGKKYGIIDTEGILVVNPSYDNIEDYKDGFLRVENMIGDRILQGIIDCTGEIIYPLEYCNIFKGYRNYFVGKKYDGNTYCLKDGVVLGKFEVAYSVGDGYKDIEVFKTSEEDIYQWCGCMGPKTYVVGVVLGYLYDDGLSYMDTIIELENAIKL